MLDRPPITPESAVSAPIPLSTDEPEQAPRFGRFVLIGQAGAGAMGTVYAAYDPALDRRVALKVLRSSTAGRQQERIRREALAMARVNHPNVVQIFEVGQHDGRLFIAMEFVDGPTLGAWQAEPRPWRETARMYGEVARGLAAAHAAGLVHRDFKPDNVLVDGDGRPRIIDFGLARAVDAPPLADDADDAADDDALLARARRQDARFTDSDDMSRSDRLLVDRLTRTGHVMGTPAYMAPELMARQPPTARSDQFAFSVAFYEALCGQAPFPRDSLIGLKLAVTRGAVLPPPADVAVPGALLEVVLRGLAPDPARRFGSMEALIAALEARVSDDELIGWRARLAVIGLFGVVIAVALFVRRSEEATLTAVDLVVSELWISAFLLACLLPFHRVLRASELHRRAALWLLVMMPAKVMMPVVGLVYGVGPPIIQAFDAVLVTAMNGMVVFLILPALWPAFLLALGALAALVLHPPWVTPLHELAVMVLPLIVVIRALGTARRAGGLSAWVGRG